VAERGLREVVRGSGRCCPDCSGAVGRKQIALKALYLPPWCPSGSGIVLLSKLQPGSGAEPKLVLLPSLSCAGVSMQPRAASSPSGTPSATLPAWCRPPPFASTPSPARTPSRCPWRTQVRARSLLAMLRATRYMTHRPVVGRHFMRLAGLGMCVLLLTTVPRCTAIRLCRRGERGL
jgi:hypothetical protein